MESQNIKCSSYNSKKFESALHQIRFLTCESPEIFVPQLKSICDAGGVCVIFVPELHNTATWGATRLLDDKFLIQLNLRYKTDDHLLFSFLCFIERQG